jgi:hypothetical protein
MAFDQRLPQVGQDDGIWGDLLRQYLMKEHFNDDTSNSANGGHKTITIQPGNSGAGEAPLKFTSGTLLSTKEAGAVEFNGNYFYASSGSPTAVRRKIAMYDPTGEAKGDIYYQDASGFFTRLPIGTQGQQLTVNGSGLPVWQSDSSTISNKVIDNTNGITVKDNSFTVQNAATTSKQMAFDLSGKVRVLSEL